MENKVVIVTGASSGIGKACAEVFGKSGAKIVITGRNVQNLEAEAKQLDQLGISNLAIVADVSNEDDNRRMVDQTIERFGGIDILINNAGISMRALFEDIELDVFRKVVDTNLMGSVYATKYCLPHILETKGTIIGPGSLRLRSPRRT